MTETTVTAPVAIVAYRRPKHLERCLAALATNAEIEKTKVTVYIDGPESTSDVAIVNQVVRVAEEQSHLMELSIVLRDKNLGLGASIIDAVNSSLESSDSIIVLEDDLIVSRYFLKFMNDGIRTYRHDPRVASIHGYVYPLALSVPPTFFLRGADCLGWATWRRAWERFESDGERLRRSMLQLGARERRLFDFGGKYPYLKMLERQARGDVDSWAIRWYASAFLNQMYTLYPGKSLVNHAGGDGSGTNVGLTSVFDVQLADQQIAVERIPVVDSRIGRRAFESYFLESRSGSRRGRRLSHVLRPVIGTFEGIFRAIARLTAMKSMGPEL